MQLAPTLRHVPFPVIGEFRHVIKAVNDLKFVKPPGFTININHMSLFFTHPVPDKEERGRSLDHYRLFANEVFFKLETMIDAFKDGSVRATVPENYLAAKKEEYVGLIEKCLLGDPAYTPWLNLEEPNEGLGERFIEIMLLYSLNAVDDKAVFIVDMLAKAMEMKADGSAHQVALIQHNPFNLT